MTGDGSVRQLTASGDQGVGAGTYRVDAYTIPASEVAAWGFPGIAQTGAYVAKFYKDMKQPATNLVANETMPVAGVTLTKNGSNAGVKYFNSTLTAIDPTLTVTGTSGVAAVDAAIPMGGSFPTFTGQGPTAMPISWEMLPGGSAPNLVFITRFHPM